MKILAIQLLRLGDIVMVAPYLQGLKAKYPAAELHLVINKEFHHVRNLLPFVDVFHLFDRRALQSKLRHRNVGYFAAFRQMDQWLKNLNSEKFDHVYNFTHNRISGYLCGRIDAKIRRGLILDTNKRPIWTEKASRFINAHGLSSDLGLVHFGDLNRIISDTPMLPFQFKNTPAGDLDWAQISQGRKYDLLLQTLTSDSKKNLSHETFQEFLKLYLRQHPTHKVGLLCAPNEVEKLKPLINPGFIDPLPLSLEGVVSALNQVRKLLTLDTSVKHIAAFTKADVVEISIGSSHLQLTSAYRHRSLILQAKEACAPCPHSSLCDRQLICHSRISPKTLVHAINGLAGTTSDVSVVRPVLVSGLGWIPLVSKLTANSLFFAIRSFMNLNRLNDCDPKATWSNFVRALRGHASSTEIAVAVETLMTTKHGYTESVRDFLKREGYHGESAVSKLMDEVQFFLEQLKTVTGDRTWKKKPTISLESR